jgi:peptide-methionine (S)-S-oxide reductase
MNYLPSFAFLLFLATAMTSSIGCQAQTASNDFGSVAEQEKSNQKTANSDDTKKTPNKKLETATFGGGCFWCTEAVFLELKGVESVKSGYMGGHVKNPTYDQICTKTTGHVEVIQIKFDPKIIRFDDLLQIHLKTHDPTSWDKQGNDEGPQYRSAVFYHSPSQKQKTESYKKKVNAANVFGRPIVTQVKKAEKFWIAEDYHQNYFKRNPNNQYCQAFIPKKLAKLRQIFGDKVKQPSGATNR